MSSSLCSYYIPIISIFIISLLHGTATAAADAGILSGNETDQLALLAFKSIIYDTGGIVNSWNDSLHHCNWEGVTCSSRHRRVTILNLAKTGLAGSLSPYIGNLTFLRELRLTNNNIQGKIPPEIGRLFRLQVLGLTNNSLVGEIPANLSYCSNLLILGLGYNDLKGKIPMEIGYMTKLTQLILHFNNLTGSIPPNIGNLTSLQILSAASNSIEGSIPESLGRLRNLTFLGLGRNQLHGTIPSSVYNLSSLTVLSVAENQFQGSLPPDSGFTLPRLQLLQLAFNNFSGSIPPSISNASELAKAGFKDNRFTGKISVDFSGLQNLESLILGSNSLGSWESNDMDFLGSLANCSKLRYLTLGSNRFGGELPDWEGRNFSTQLKRLELHNNQISGGIPPWMGNLVGLQVLFLGFNQLKGQIPAEIGSLQKLQELSLDSNNLSGAIPSSLGNLSLLNVLYMDNNRLQGAIPASIENCKYLERLDLSRNNLTDTIPEQLLSISTLSISLNLSLNQFVGQLHPNVGNLKNLVELDLSGNKLSGEIPGSLGSCTSLEYLYIKGNSFQGSIPPSLSSLRGLRKLDLSANNLSGQIPKYLEDFALEYVNLSFNHFEGQVPIKGVFKNASEISVAGNDRLCGGLSELHLPRCNFEESKGEKLSRVQIIIIISAALALLGATIMSAFLFLRFKRKRKKQSSGPLLKESLLQISYGTIFKATNGFSSSNLIGVGSFGSVFKGILDQDGTTIAVKVLNLQRQGAFKSFMAECEALRNIRHRNLVKIITSCSSVDFQGNDFKALIYEFMPNGSLERWLNSTPEIDDVNQEVRILDLHQRINVAVDVACALDYLHHRCQSTIVHCDLKPSNILLDGEMTAHVGDFGLAKILSEVTNPHQSSLVAIRGTVGYAAPEYGLGSAVSMKGDIYSYGIMLLEMLTGKRPTDPMFGGELNLHNFAKMALPDQVLEIVDPILLKEDEAAAADINNHSRIQARNDSRMDSLISLIKIGVACSMPSPQDRMDITSVIHQLELAGKILFGTGNGKT